MKANFRIIIVFVLIAGLQVSNNCVFSQDQSPLDLSLRKEADHSIQMGLKWLIENQEENGSWQFHPGMTGLVLSAFLRSGFDFQLKDSAISRGFDFLLTCVQPDGSIFQESMPNYNTAVCLMAFKDAKNEKFKDIIHNAENYLMKLQIDESEDFSIDSLYYGGVGYGGDERPDLSNLQWAIEAMAENENPEIEKNYSEEEKSRLREKKIFYDKALVFLSRCQNLKNVNPEIYAGNDGGFMYEPGKSKAGATNSYGSMTYAGLKSMIYANVAKDDRRVVAAYRWLTENYSIETTPQMGDQGLFYYYQTMAKALTAYGEDFIPVEGTNHNWRNELARHIISIQNEEGWWQNENNRWWENNKVLVTAYCLLSLEEMLK
ncbi:MAG: terpene cyclase/mutase family protein [Bacteroidales bacterium]|nr:terpene cyclase/mutase family protein [Bacteroidales bacterium]MCF8455668.1 terpene cyclase/mutase family protein [Bacteroidales bacterium]